MQSSECVGPVLGHEYRLVVLLEPGLRLADDVAGYSVQLARLVVPRVVAVEADHVEVLTLESVNVTLVYKHCIVH